MSRDGALKIKISDDVPPITPGEWRYAGVRDPKGGALNLRVSDDTYTEPTIPDGGFDFGTPSVGTATGDPQPEITEWGKIFYTDRMGTSYQTAHVDSGPTSPTTVTHTVNIDPGPSQGDWDQYPLGSDDHFIAALTWRSADYDRSGTVETGNPSFDPATDGPTGFTLVGATGAIDSTGWTEPRPSVDGVRLAVWFASYDDISPDTDVSVTVNAASKLRVWRIKNLPGKPAPSISLVDAGTATESDVREYVFFSGWAYGEPYGTMAFLVGGSTQYSSASLSRDLDISGGMESAGNSESTYYSSWVGFKFETPPGTEFDEPLTAAAVPDFRLALEGVSSTGGVTTYDGGTVADNSWVLEEYGEEWWYQLAPGSSVTAAAYDWGPIPDGAVGVGVAVLAEHVTDGDVTVTLSGPGLSATAFFPTGTFPAMGTFGLDMWLTEVVTFYLPDAPAPWIQAHEDETLEVTITTTGTHRLHGMSMVATYPVGSAFKSGWVTPNKDYLIDDLVGQGTLRDGLDARMQPYPPSLDDDSIPDLWGGDPPEDIGYYAVDSGFYRSGAIINGNGSDTHEGISGLYYKDTQVRASKLWHFGFEDEESFFSWYPDVTPGFDGYDRGAVGYEYETGPAVIWDYLGSWDWKNPSHRRWDSSYNRVGEHPEATLDPGGEVTFEWRINHDIPGGPPTQWNMKWATNATVIPGDKAADPWDWDDFVPTNHEPSGPLAILPAPPAVQGAYQLVDSPVPMTWALSPGVNTVPGKSRTYALQAATDDQNRPFLDGPVSLFSSDDARTAIDLVWGQGSETEARWGITGGQYRLLFPSNWSPSGHSDQPYPGGSTITPGNYGASSGEWHTIDFYEPPAGGSRGVHPEPYREGWAFIGWGRLEGQPNSGRRGALWLRIG